MPFRLLRLSIIFAALVFVIGARVFAQAQTSPLKQDTSPQPQDRIHHISVFGNALYWTVSETVDWALTLDQGETSGHTDYLTLSYDWEPGFRAGLGYHMDCANWDTQLYYTHYSAKTSAHANAGTGLIDPAFLGNRAASFLIFTYNYQTAKANWHLSFDMADWDLRCLFRVCKPLTIQPYLGIKGGSIKQSIHSKWDNPHLFLLGGRLSATENLKNDFWGIGPKGGVNTKWILGSPERWFFSLFGEIEAAYMWGRWTIRDTYKNSLGQKAIVTVGDRKFGSFMVRAFMGIGFDLNNCRNQSHVSFKVGYELQDWFNQFQIFDNGTGGHTNDLVLHGLTAQARFDF